MGITRTGLKTLEITAVGLFAAGLGLMMLTGCGQSSWAKPAGNGEQSASGKAARVETVTVEKQDLSQTVEMPATVEGYESADLYAKVGGYLKEFAINPETQRPFDIGDHAKKGQVLAHLWIPEMQKEIAQKQALIKQAQADAQQAQAAIRQSEADLKSAQAVYDEAKAERGEKQAQVEYRLADLRRFEELVRKQSVRGELLDQAKLQYEAARAALQTVEARIRTAEAKVNAAEASVTKAKADHTSALARTDVARANAEHTQTMADYATIRAPFNGYITERWMHPGAFIQPAEGNSAAKPLLSMARTDLVRISLDIPMNDVRLLDRGDRAVLDRITALPGETIEGAVTRFSPSLNKRSRLMRMEIELENKDGKLRPGYYGYVTVYLEEQPNTPTIPSSALLAERNETYVFVVEDGTARKRPVTVGYQDGAIVGLASGLKGQEQVIKAGGGQITNGQKVKTGSNP